MSASHTLQISVSHFSQKSDAQRPQLFSHAGWPSARTKALEERGGEGARSGAGERWRPNAISVVGEGRTGDGEDERTGMDGGPRAGTMKEARGGLGSDERAPSLDSSIQNIMLCVGISRSRAAIARSTLSEAGVVPPADNSNNPAISEGDWDLDVFKMDL